MTIFSASISSLNLETRNYIADPPDDSSTITFKSLMEVYDETTHFCYQFSRGPKIHFSKIHGEVFARSISRHQHIDMVLGVHSN
jgi:hypothetical protein